MVQKTLVLTILLSLISWSAIAAEGPWIFTTSLATKNETITIPRKEFCRPISTAVLSDKCMQYKQGYICPQDNNGQFVISTYENKKSCEKALKRTKKLFAQK